MSERPRAALQLFSVREPLEADFDGTIARLAEMGYAGVETGFFEVPENLSELAERIRGSGMEICSAHVPLPIGEGPHEALEQAAGMGVRRIVWHGWPEDERYRSAEGIAELVAEYNEAAQVASDAGLELGLHNHWWELEERDGRRAYDVLLAEVDPRVFFQPDVYWVAAAGLDVAELLGRMSGRIPLVHVKDGPIDDRDAAMVALGEGRVDLPPALAASQEAEWLIVEFDSCDTDIFEAVEKSLRYLVDGGFANGR